MATAETPNASLGARDGGLVALVILAWAGNFLFSKLALRELPPILYTALRLLVLGVALAPFMKRPPAGQGRRLALFAILTAVHFGLGFWALRLSSVIGAPMIVLQSYVPMSAILARLVYGEVVSRPKALAILVSFAGVLVLGFDPAFLASPLALTLVLVSALFLALGTVVMRRLVGLDMPSQQGWTAVIGCGPLLVWSALVEKDLWAAVTHASLWAWVGVAYAALVVSLVGHGLYFVLVRRHPVAQVTPYLLASPVLTVILGVVFLHDPVTWRLVVGGVMVLGGVLLPQLTARRMV